MPLPITIGSIFIVYLVLLSIFEHMLSKFLQSDTEGKKDE